jgi:hypothetical protein
MPAIDISNTCFQTAVSFVNGTNKHLFITGKAGTGKTTFLKFIRENCLKKMAVVAPTGVAAINAGGVTIHSFFQLPFGAFIPSGVQGWNGLQMGANNANSLTRNLRLTTAKRDVIKELELLVIDEVSMVRADLLDAVDTVLRHIRKQPLLPFGGVQMVYIGDLFQLPPVVNNAEWEMLNEYYESPFFFNAHAVRQTSPVYIELKKIYRQTDDRFINLLNNVRNNCCTTEDIQHLHEHYRHDFNPEKEEGYITLTSHNAKADAINKTELEKLPGKLFSFEAKVTGEFSDRAYPADKTLYVKEGAQIMFIKNDKGEARRFYNGKIATIDSINEEKITIAFKDNSPALELELEEWKNILYNYNNEEDSIEEENLGTFSQYPIRLAWAITIHKSQGLTFEKAIIDAGAAFAPGQVYVALSRLTSLAGLVLLSRIPPSAISTDTRTGSFAKTQLDDNKLEQVLHQEQKAYMQYMLMKNFNWGTLTDAVSNHLEPYHGRQIPEKEKCIMWATKMQEQVMEQQEVAEKFTTHLQHLFTTCEADHYKQLNERIQAAAGYFKDELSLHMVQPLRAHIDSMKKKARVKKYVKELLQLQVSVERKLQQLEQAIHLAKALHAGTDTSALLKIVEEEKKLKPAAVEQLAEASIKQRKGDSHRLSLQLFKQGKTIAEIAQERSLAPSTIEGHLAKSILTGDIDILDLISAEKLDKIIPLIQDEVSHVYLKEQLGPDFSFAEIRAAANFVTFEKQQRVSS